MSAYEIARLCRQALREPALRERLRAAPAQTVDTEFDLTAAEREAMLAGEVGVLADLGCNTFLLSYLPRWGLFGLDVARYGERMRAGRGAERTNTDAPTHTPTDAPTHPPIRANGVPVPMTAVAMPPVLGLPPAPPLPAATELSAELADLLRPRIARLGYLGGFFAVAARQPDALAGFIRFTESLKKAVPDDLAEVVALRVAVRLSNAYEQAQHEALARTHGMSEAWLAAVTVLADADADDSTAQGRLSDQLSADQRLVRDLSDAVLADAGHGAGDAVVACAERFGADTTVALVLLISRFTAHAHAANAFALIDPLAELRTAQPAPTDPAPPTKEMP